MASVMRGFTPMVLMGSVSDTFAERQGKNHLKSGGIETTKLRH
jgi:hypothetical protein